MANVVRIDGTDRQLPSPEPDAHGQAALVLAEGLLHALVDARTITTEKALAIVHTAQEVKEEARKDSNETSGTVARSLHLLGRIATSLEADLNERELPVRLPGD